MLRLRGVSWEWRENASAEIEPGTREAGVIAQEVEVVFPDLVTTREDGYLMVDYGGLAMRVASAFDELTRKVDRMDDAEIREVLTKLGLDADPDTPLSDADYRAVIGALIETAKELDARIEALERAADDNRG